MHEFRKRENVSKRMPMRESKATCTINDPDLLYSKSGQRTFKEFVVVGFDSTHEMEGVTGIELISACSVKNLFRAMSIIENAIDGAIDSLPMHEKMEILAEMMKDLNERERRM